MSWQAYVDSSLIGTGDVDQAAIFNNAGTSVWAASLGFEVKPAELQAVIGSFQDSGMNLRIKGLYIGGQKYILLKADERSIYGKQGKTGIIIVKTKQALLVAHYPSDVQPGTATSTVEKLADYLIKVGY